MELQQDSRFLVRINEHTYRISLSDAHVSEMARVRLNVLRRCAVPARDSGSTVIHRYVVLRGRREYYSEITISTTSFFTNSLVE